MSGNGRPWVFSVKVQEQYRPFSNQKTSRIAADAHIPARVLIERLAVVHFLRHPSIHETCHTLFNIWSAMTRCAVRGLSQDLQLELFSAVEVKIAKRFFRTSPHRSVKWPALRVWRVFRGSIFEYDLHAYHTHLLPSESPELEFHDASTVVSFEELHFILAHFGNFGLWFWRAKLRHLLLKQPTEPEWSEQ